MSQRLNFCTLFDSNYLTRGIVLYDSLATNCADFHLYVLAFDSLCAHVLAALSLPNMTVVHLAEFEDERMLRIKNDRTTTEYCWTCASHFTRYCIVHYSLDICTYVDADMKFYNDPSVIFEEDQGASIFITPHRYTHKYDISKLSGIFCVQFVSFKNDKLGMTALDWWCDACEEWCYNRHEDGKFGDQKYLDDWPTRFEGVHVVQHLGAGLAVWNIQQYNCESEGDEIICQELTTMRKFEPIFYHYHYLKFYTDHTVELGRKEISSAFLNVFYSPYIKDLLKMNARVSEVYERRDYNGTRQTPSGLKHILVSLWRKVMGIYHIYSLNDYA